MATGSALKNTKALVAAAVGFIAPGAAYLLGVGGDGITGNEWLMAGLSCVVGGAVAGGAVYKVENKPKA